MESYNTLNLPASYDHHMIIHLSRPHLLMASFKPLNPSAPPFLPAPPPPPATLLPPVFQFWHHPHCHRPFIVGGLGGKKAVKKGAPYCGGGRIRSSVPPRLKFRLREDDKPPRFARVSDNNLRWVPKHFKIPEGTLTENTAIAANAADDEGEDVRGGRGAEDSGLDGRTTVMMRNIPNLMKRQELIEILDDHCSKANAENPKTEPRSEYDFVYLPIDYERKLNKGYAFVNFTSAEAAVRIWTAFNGMKWEGFRWKDYVYRTKKVCQICAATIQGKAKLEISFRCRAFPSEEYQPVLAAAAPRDGVNGAELTLVGNRSTAGVH